MQNNLNNEYNRYLRQILVKEVGGQGQKRLENSKVLVVGAGGLGSPLVLYLSAAGIGTLGLIDYDSVELSNLQRQILFKSSDVGSKKVKSAMSVVNNLNPAVNFLGIEKKLSSYSDTKILNEYDIIIDGSDSIKVKNLVAKRCVEAKKVLITGSASTWDGQIFIYQPEESISCYSCIYGELSDNNSNECTDFGIIGTVTGIIGSIMANEAIKLIVGAPSFLINTLYIFDGLSQDFRKIKVPKNPKCRVCS
mgnify:FL=1